jgi:Integrase core domain
VALSNVRMPRMNGVVERWAQTCRHELLDRTLVWNQVHLPRAPSEFEHFYDEHRPHQGIANARPFAAATRATPRLRQHHAPSTSEDATASAASRTNTNMPPDLCGWNYRQAQC